MQGLSINNLMEEVSGISKESSDLADMLNRFGERARVLLNADAVIAKDVFHKNHTLNVADEFVLNTRKPYVDNMLSGYSAFTELISYFNEGFKSCLMLPITAETKALGIITLLSRREDGFSKGDAEVLGLIGSLLGYESNSKLERERSTNIAKYFDASFDSITPQAIIDRRGGIAKANKSMFALLNKTGIELNGRNIGEFLGINIESIETARMGVGAGLCILKGKREFVIYGKPISEGLSHLLFYETTELRELEDKNRFLDLSTDDIFLMLDEGARIIWASGNIDGILKVDKDNIIGRKLTDLTEGIDIYKELGKLGDKQCTNYVRFNLDNNVYVDLKASAFRSRSGFALILSKNIESYINNMKKDLYALAELSGDVIITTDSLGYIKGVNKSVERLLRYRNDDIVGVSISSICSDKESQSRITAALGMAKNRDIVTDLFVNLTKSNDGEPVPFEQGVKTTRDETGRLTGYMIVGRELETKRSREKYKSEWEKMSKEAERYKSASQLKTQFINNISHDLKTPLTNIIGFSKLLIGGQFGELSEEQKGEIGTIIDESERLMQLIAQVLDVAKLDSGKVRLDMQAVDFRVLKENPSIKSMADVAIEKGLEFGFDVDYDVPEINADPNRLIQVFVNLLGNAVNFTQHGSIHVKAFRKGRNVRIEVKDTGIGVNKEDQTKLFKKFFQLNRKGLSRREGEGTGLGLSITKEIVNLHGGRIGVESEPGKGSTFWFTIPIYGRQKKRPKPKTE